LRKARHARLRADARRIDKLGRGIQGDPSSALLEGARSAQNSTSDDKLSRRAFDLSTVLFIATANQLDTIPGPLLERMEVIQLSGYTISEKRRSARYLVPRQRQENGLTADSARSPMRPLRAIITDTRAKRGCEPPSEPIGSVFRHAAARGPRGTVVHVRIDVADLAEILGAARFEAEVAQRTQRARRRHRHGLDAGRREQSCSTRPTRVPGHGKLILTGQLGRRHEESAQAALSLVKSKHRERRHRFQLFDESDIHGMCRPAPSPRTAERGRGHVHRPGLRWSPTAPCAATSP